MTLSWKPTTGDIYTIYEIVNGYRKKLGTTTKGSFTIPSWEIKKGTHDYVVTARNALGESRPSNDIHFRKRIVRDAGGKTMNKKIGLLIFALLLPWVTNGHAQSNVMVVNPAARPVQVSSGVATFKGAANYANGQVTAGVTASTLVAARPTRRSVTIRNMDATISVYIGAATVSATNGFLLKANESVNVDSTALIQVIAASGTPIVAYLESYD